MAAAENAIFIAVITVGFAGVVGYGFYRVITVKGEAAAASDYGRKWLAWMILVGSVVTLPRFFRNLDADSFARWAIVVISYGAVAFIAGWVYGKYFGKNKGKLQEVDENNESAKNVDDSGRVKGRVVDSEDSLSETVTQHGLSGTIRLETTSMKNYDPYQHAWRELESGAFDKSLWAKAFAEADGDENKAKAAYIRFRVAALTNEARQKTQQKAAELACLAPELIKVREEIFRRFTFYPDVATDKRVAASIASLDKTQWNNEPDKIIKAIVALDATLDDQLSVKREIFGTYLSDTISKWQSKSRGKASHRVKRRKRSKP